MDVIRKDLNTYPKEDIDTAIANLGFITKTELVSYIFSLLKCQSGKISGKFLDLYNRLGNSSLTDEIIRAIFIEAGFKEIAHTPMEILNNTNIHDQYIKTPSNEINDQFIQRKLIGDGIAGQAVSFQNIDKSYNFCAKFGLDIYKNDDPLWEYTVSRKLNKFHPFVPHTFFGTYTRTTPAFDMLISNMKPTTMLYVQEEVETVMNLYDFYEGNHHYKYEVQMQLLLVLACLQSVRFTHYDLHGGNVLLRKAKPNTYMEYTFYNGVTRVLYMPYIVTILDFGRSFVDQMPYNMLQNKKEELKKKTFIKAAGGFTDRYNQYSDLFKVLFIAEDFGVMRFSHDNLIDVLGNVESDEPHLLTHAADITPDSKYDPAHFIESFILNNMDILDKATLTKLPDDPETIYSLDGKGNITVKNETHFHSSTEEHMSETENITRRARLSRKFTAPEEPTALTFYKTELDFYNVSMYGVRNKLFTSDEADADRTMAIRKVEQHLLKRLKAYLSEEDYDSISVLTNEEPTEENLEKYSKKVKNI